MAKVTIQGVGVVNFPDNMTPEQIQQAIETDILPNASKPQTPPQKPEELSMLDKALARIPISKNADYLLNRLRGFAMGAADPTVGAVQLGANMIGQGENVNRAIDAKEQAYEQERKAVGAEGFDVARLAGNVASPVNAVVAAKIPVTAATAGKAAVQGAKVGAIGGLTQPVTDLKEGQSFALTKGAQTAMGAAAGGALTPVLNKLATSITSRMQPGETPEQIITKAMADIGIKPQDLSQDAFDALRNQVAQSLKTGKKLDSQALLRSADFESLNIKPLQGQITRDPTQFAAERNLSAVRGVGDPLMDRLTAQNQALEQLLAKQAGGQEVYQAGKMVSESLKKTDDAMRQKVSSLYTQARESAGRSTELPMQGLAQDFANVLNDFADKVPSAIVNRMKSYGLMGENQTKLYTVEEADKLLKLINQHVGSDAATNNALAELRNAVKKSVLDVTDDVFAEGRQAAAKRFQIQDMIPALKAASGNDVAADDFVRKFVINGKTDDVSALGKLLQASDTETFDEMRRQIGTALQRAAFGENVAGDAIFTPARYNKFLRNIGTDKLKAFFSPEEIAEFQRIGRVGAYINQRPAASPVLSNPNSWMLTPIKGLIETIPGGRYINGLASVLKQTADASSVANRALNPKVPTVTPNMSDDKARRLAQLLSGAAVASGGVGASPLR